jgi:hypothetical protein
MKRVPEHAFTGLSTKARITITASACWERTRAEGGSLQAIGDLMFEAKNGRKAKIYDLHTGRFLMFRGVDDMEAGEYIFYRCLEEVLEMSPEESSQVFVTVVKEPGKARTVTKGMIALKIVLDVINKIVSYPLSKVETSKSGMGMDAHGWNLFVDMFKHREETFVKTSISDEEATTKKRIRTVTYQDLYAECTDFTNATDAMNHMIGWLIAKKWMDKCGIPRILQIIVHKTCFKPRKVFFNAKSIFCDIGVDDGTGTCTHYVTLLNGLMMGDPLTKVILHFTNISIRELGRYVALGKYTELIEDQPVRPLSCDVDTGMLPYVDDGPIIVEDMRTVRTPEGDRSVWPIPARIMPAPSTETVISQLLADTIKNRDSVEGRITIPLPGVLVLFNNKSSGHDMIDMGFIPKEYRDPNMLSITHVKVMEGRTARITGIRNPDDRILLMKGFRPINPYRGKIILNEFDRIEMNRDHASYFERGLLPENRTSKRQVQKAPDTKREPFNVFKWFGF